MSHPARQQRSHLEVPGPWAERLGQELRPRSIVTSLNAALIVYLFEVILALSFTALVFSHGRLDLLPVALGSVLVGATVLVGITGLLGSYGGTVPAVQDAPSVALALAAGAVVGSLGAIDDGATSATVLVLVAGTTLLFGAVCLVLGAFRLGALVRFLPYPVLGGFLAGTGWLIVVGGIGVAADEPFGTELLADGELVRWLPALVLGCVGFLAHRRWESPLVLPIVLGIFLLGFYGLAWSAGVSTDALSDEGWLLGPFPADIGMTVPFQPALLEAVSWPAIISAVPLAAPAILFGVLGVLLNASSIELVVRRELRLDRELVVTGGANVVGGLLGGLPGYATISVTVLGHTLGQGRRLPALIVVVLLLATVAVGMSALSFVPRTLVAGLLIAIGLTLLYRWVVEARSTFSRPDYLVVLAVLLVIALTDLLWGVTLGLVLTIVLFVIDYSHVSLVRFDLTGADLRSRVDRSPRETELLRQHGSELVILALQDYLFFGSAHRLVEHVRHRLAGVDGMRVRAVLLDLERVSGIDSTALLGIDKLLQELRAHGVELIVTGQRPDIARQLQASGLRTGAEGVHVFPDLDRGVEFGEEVVLAVHRIDDAAIPLAAELSATLPGETRTAELVERMERLELDSGEVVVRQGSESDDLYIIESGQLSVLREREGQQGLRLTTMRRGRLVGEIGFFLRTPRSATVVADRPSVLRRLSRTEWERLQASDPDLAGIIERLTVRGLAQRVMDYDRTLDALLH